MASSDGLPSAMEQSHAAPAVTSDAAAALAPQTLLNGTSSEQTNGLVNGTSETMSRSNSATPGMTPTRARSMQRTLDSARKGHLHRPVTFCSSFADPQTGANGASSSSALTSQGDEASKMVLELADGTAFQGYSFGAPHKSISGECVFQTGKSRHVPTSFTRSVSAPLVCDECFVGTSPNAAPHAGQCTEDA